MAERIKERRNIMGLTQEELGQKLGLQKSAIAKYENGRVENIKRSVISNMAKILECSPCYLLDWEENKEELNDNIKKKGNMTIGNLIKQYRMENKISMDEFSKKSSLSKGYISMLENNIGPRRSTPIAPTLSSLKKIATGMDMDVDTLLKCLDGKQEVSLSKENIENIEQHSIFSYYQSLNSTGKEIATEQVRLLTLDKKYTQPDNIVPITEASVPDYLEINAAHERTDIEVTQEDIEHDDALMNDDSIWQ